ncbi:hypothetical protein INT48_007760 [Thamnidium elegans]|uniref:Uncharacterized protein n=1 Tax=Thamnidium elegans TaxID=101142 RepID=A0A8H7SMJ1_9FUNG|nr:hypothetical protein INT48_007760 [Thamnidium elegans]
MIMPCLGARKKPNSTASRSIIHDKSVVEAIPSRVPSSIAPSRAANIISKQAAELDQLRKEVSIKSLSVSDPIETRSQELEKLLEERNQQIQELVDRLNIDCEQDNQIHLELQEKDRLLQEKQCQLEELKAQWESERAELIKPALQQVNTQLEELKETNKIAVDRLTEKENELAELRAQLNRRDRKPKQSSKDQDNQKRLNRLTMDLENDRLLIQRLDELNQQLETQKQKHETILESHAKVIAEKDHALLQQQKSLKQLKISHDNATKTLEQEQLHSLKKLQLQHQNDMTVLKKRLKTAETQAKSTVDDELDQILVEFEQSQHNHSIQVASLQQSYKEQITVMKQGQQAEMQSLIDTKRVKQRQPSVSKLRDSKFQWPPTAAPAPAASSIAG